MTDEARRHRASRSLRVHYRLVPWWAKVTVVYVLSRLVTTVFLVDLARGQGLNAWTAARPGYFDFANIWDGRWYQLIAQSGYPAILPLDAAGNVAQNAWAFLPGYPWAVRAVMSVTGMSWSVAAVVVSVLFGYGAALLLYRLFRTRFGISVSLFAVVLFCVSPVSPLLQLAYAEPMYLFLLFLGLLLTVRGRMWTLLPVVVAMGFTRPSGLAFALMLGLYFLVRLWGRRREPFPLRAATAHAVATLTALVAGVAWPAIAALVTGSAGAYTDTEMAWRSSYSAGFARFLPFTPWLEGANWWLGAPLGTVVMLALLIAFALAMASGAVRRLGAVLWLWVASYALYLLAVFFPQSSTFRILMPMAPLLGALALPRNPVYRVLLVVLSLLGQWWWLVICWRISPADWTPP